MGYSWPGVLVDVRGASGRTGRFFHPAVVPRPHFIQFSLRPSVVYYVFLIWLVSFSRYLNKPSVCLAASRTQGLCAFLWSLLRFRGERLFNTVT